MKKLLFLVVMIFICGASVATTQCVQFPTTNGSSFTYTDYKPDWSITWSNGFVATGTSTCSNIAGEKQGVSGDPTWSSVTATANIYCWCKLETPAVSAWVFNQTQKEWAACAQKCSYQCSNIIRTNSAFRINMFSTVR